MAIIPVFLNRHSAQSFLPVRQMYQSFIFSLIQDFEGLSIE